MRTIEQDTPILPFIVAESVIGKAEQLTNKSIPVAAVDYLVERAEQVYRHNKTFAKKIRASGNAGRDHLYVFMEHWLAAYLKKNDPEIHGALPRGYGISYSPTIHGMRQFVSEMSAFNKPPFRKRKKR
jgi:hypothetical protein